MIEDKDNKNQTLKERCGYIDDNNTLYSFGYLEKEDLGTDESLKHPVTKIVLKGMLEKALKRNWVDLKLCAKVPLSFKRGIFYDSDMGYHYYLLKLIKKDSSFQNN